jgi:hypothetical protein
MPELVVDTPETLLDLSGKARSKAKPAKAEKRIYAVHGYKDNKYCVLTGYYCRKGDCRICHYPDGHDDSRARELEAALQNVQEELKDTQLKLKVFESMKAIMARTYEQFQAEKVMIDGQPHE